MTAFAAATATTASYEKIRDAATAGQGNKPARTTTRPYRETLEQLWIIDQAPAWRPGRNYFSELGEEIGDELLDAVVINTGPGCYRREDGIAIVPAALLGP